MTPLVSIKDLVVTFGHGPDQVQAVRHISLDVAEGESFGIVGESGSGKSTVLRAICGLAPVTVLDGQVRAKETPEAVIQHVKKTLALT